ncbi:MAG TPA: cobalt-precorrin-5B (C(1))-methyltransferase [Bacillus bacterium]|nr:cobalt-precorrin-5B (C(1))-methyltransferase [Bacillus sp. (in: firmicutes)]
MEDSKTETKKQLKYGYTTGACATAATKAALLALITGKVVEHVKIYIPAGEHVMFEIVECNLYNDKAIAGVIKDGGDDPDATHGALILATVQWTAEEGFQLDGGIGVGRITKPGLPIPIGEAAINPIPRKMIKETVQELLNEFEINRGISVTISVPDGEIIAKKTLNARLGVIGGISILGTRGIVVPFSSSAYMASIVQYIKVAHANECEHVVITTGGRSEKYAMKTYPHLREEAFIEMGDFVGFTLKQCKKQGVKKVSMVGMMGKFSKIAKGDMMVHSKGSQVDFQFLAEVAKMSGAPENVIAEIREANTASQVGDLMAVLGTHTFFETLCHLCNQAAYKEIKGGIDIETVLFTLNGEFLGRAILHD